MYKYNMQIHI